MKDIGQRLTQHMLETPEWDNSFDIQELYISDPERANRMNEAVECGADGSTHQERIQDQRDCAETMYRWDRDLPNVLNAIDEYLDEVEEWHSQNGSLFQEIG